jgi:2-hydroxy-3-keto-5-methylthiopentenyl-1-phosphate phosphatase
MLNLKRQSRIVFCDFDGTITAQETFVAVLKQFSPELAKELIPQMYELKVTLREGVRRILESIPSSQLANIIEFAQSQPMRAGFPEFLDFLKSQNIEFVVISGGLRVMVETVLGKELIKKVTAIHAIDVDTTGSHLQVISNYEGESELVDKVKVMSLYKTQQPIVIGDSVTDLNMALNSPVVFARDRLKVYLDERQKPYIDWHDFWEIRDIVSLKFI